MIHVDIDDLVLPLTRLADRPRQNPDHHLAPWIAELCGIEAAMVRDVQIERRSLDARQRGRPSYRYRLVATVDDSAMVREGPGIRIRTSPPPQDDRLYHLDLAADRPREALIVGTGPAGIMAAYLLAFHGTRVLILDRGYDVDRRGQDIARFHRNRQLDPNSNYLLGEGGAGTYSDGKLYTRVKDRRMRFLLEAFVAARAPRHILYRHHPHIGSDLLPHMARRLRQQIEAWAGRFRWGCEVVDLIVEQDRCVGVVLADGERIRSESTLIAPGHSARGLITALCRRGVTHKAKGYQLGCRIEHPQELINEGRLGCQPLPPLFGAAEYHLVSRPRREHAGSTTTFCMCPGGEIIAATSDPGQLSTNGMSPFARAGRFANAGLIVNQPVDAASGGLAGFAAIEALERAAYDAGGGDYTCPAQDAIAFARGEDGLRSDATSYRLGMRPGRIDQILPVATVKALRAALNHFERQIPGFLSHGTLVGIESRVSSPVRFERDPETLASALPGLYLAGEGAGYAGGIVSAGLDGLRLAETILTGRAARRER